MSIAEGKKCQEVTPDFAKRKSLSRLTLHRRLETCVPLEMMQQHHELRRCELVERSQLRQIRDNRRAEDLVEHPTDDFPILRFAAESSDEPGELPSDFGLQRKTDAGQ